MNPLIILLFRVGLTLVLFGCALQCGLNAAEDFGSHKIAKGVFWLFGGVLLIVAWAPVWLIR